MARETLNGAHGGGQMPRAPAVETLLDIAAEDWDDLLSAVKTRLRMTVGAATMPPGELLSGPLGRIQASVLECVAALDQLHMALQHERGRCDRLEREADAIQAELDDARSELRAAQA